MKPSDLGPVSEAIMKRRSIYPKFYTSKKIDNETIQTVLSHANRAPSHRNTEPWRFIVFKNKSLVSLSDYLANYYKQNTSPDKFSKLKYEKTKNKPLKSGAVIAIVMERNEDFVPEWEEIAAVACAVQNIYLVCHELQIGGYWSTPVSMMNANDFLNLSTNQRCLGLFYMGYFDESPPTAKKGDVHQKIRWF